MKEGHRFDKDLVKLGNVPISWGERGGQPRYRSALT